MPLRVTFDLTGLRCIAESDARGGSEPYLWVTYFMVDGRTLGQPTPVIVHTPAHDAFRRDFPDGVRAGQVVRVPSFIAQGSFEMELDAAPFAMAGCVAVLLEEDETPEDAIIAGRVAYAKEIEAQLNALVRTRLRTLDKADITDAEVSAIRTAVNAKVKAAIRARLSLGQEVFGDQDDMLGFAHVALIGEEIVAGDLAFPEFGKPGSKNRYQLLGRLSVAPAVPPPPPDRCAGLRLAAQQRRQELEALRKQVELLQARLQAAAPAAKPGIIKQIEALAPRVIRAEEQLRVALAALRLCEEGVIQQ